MNYRVIGSTGIETSAIGLGCSRLGSVASGVGGRAASRLVEEALELGINFFDTANIYGQGQSEEILGRVLRKKRDQVVIVTKAGYQLGAARSALVSFLKPLLGSTVRRFRRAGAMTARVRSASMRQDFSPSTIVRSLEGSLHRLQTDHVDIFMLHSLPEERLDDDRLFGSLEKLKSSGKLLHYGISMVAFPEGFARRLPKEVEVAGSAINPSEPGNLAQLPQLASRNVAVIGYRPFASGSLFSDGNVKERGNDVGVPSEASSRAAQAIRFVLEQPGVANVVLGTTSATHLRDNVRALGSEVP